MHPIMIMTETLQGSQIQADPGSDLNVIKVEAARTKFLELHTYTSRSSSTELELLLDFSDLRNRNENARFTYSLLQSQRTEIALMGVFFFFG